MTLIEQIKRDREAGTPGPWQRAKSLRNHRLDDFNVDGPDRRGICSTGGYADGKEGTHDENKANARRIARVPDLEAALLAADELATAASWLADSSQLEIGHDYDDGKDPLSVINNALAAYRAAVSGAAT